MPMKYLLHAGCGHPSNKPPFEFSAFKEVRLDADKNSKPDIIASIVAMPMVETDGFDAIFCSHTLEHLYPYQVADAMAEFNRVLKPGGYVLVHVPDLQAIGGRLALDQADNVLYMSHIGPITPLDMLYGLRSAVGAGNKFMAHHTGFTASVLQRAFEEAGFHKIRVDRGPPDFELKGYATKMVQSNGEASHASKEPEAESVSVRNEGVGVGS